jgi:hypothetical protein
MYKIYVHTKLIIFVIERFFDCPQIPAGIRVISRHTRFHSTEAFLLRHAWLSLWDKHVITLVGSTMAIEWYSCIWGCSLTGSLYYISCCSVGTVNQISGVPCFYCKNNCRFKFRLDNSWIEIYDALFPVAMVTMLECVKIWAILSAPVGCHGFKFLQQPAVPLPEQSGMAR